MIWRDRFLQKRMQSDRFLNGRSWAASHLYGTVLEIGAGAGENFSHYPDAVTGVYALEPSQELSSHINDHRLIEILASPAEKIDLPDNSIDSVLSTWVLCSVSDLTEVTEEINRILKPGGLFISIEHGCFKHPVAKKFQLLINPIWKLIFGCNCNRNYIDTLYKKFSMTYEYHSGTEYRFILKKTES